MAEGLIRIARPAKSDKSLSSRHLHRLLCSGRHFSCFISTWTHCCLQTLSSMASIESLLNPLPDASQFSLPSPAPTSADPVSCSEPRQKRPKIAKDAPIFNRGKIRGELRYPPCEERSEALIQAHRQFQLHPMGDIAEYPRHIPYNSDKKSFAEKTGRESFEGMSCFIYVPRQRS